ncbi:unnamed protein product [Ilex paraguariensis]|uniref:GRF-type domain-containing protein n=1 Tax=Ilex paraguariensis TaxID=185542 RepID=A0ABC8U2E0_9AQUA
MESKGVVSRRKKKMEHMSCYCGTGTKMFTSWRYQNPGRRFLRCKNHKQSGGCGYFEWYDPSMCNQLKNIILDLLRKDVGDLANSDMDSGVDELEELRREQEQIE